MSERRVYIAHLLCHKRHYLMIATGEYDSDEAAEQLRADIRQKFDQLVAQKICRSTCVFCGSNDFYTEIRRTNFQTMTDAEPRFPMFSVPEQELRERLTEMFLKTHRN